MQTDVASTEQSCLENSPAFALPPDDTFFVAEMLDLTAICQTFDNLRGQVVAAKAALFSCVKMRDNPLQRHEAGELPVLVERASLFLHRATTGNVLVFVEDVVREECRLIHAVGFPRTHSGLRSCSISSHDQQGHPSQTRCKELVQVLFLKSRVPLGTPASAVEQCLAVRIASLVSDGRTPPLG